MLQCLDGGAIKLSVTKTYGHENGVGNWELLDADSARAAVASHNGGELACHQKATAVMLSDKVMNCVGFEENSISDISKRMLGIKGDKMKSGDVLPRLGRKFDNNHGNIDNDNIIIIDPPFVKEGNFGHDRKREPMLGLLTWLKGIAKNPCDPSICSLPEKSKWKSYGNEEIWKQVLLVREAMFVKRHVDSSSEQSFLQRHQRMHPCMYDNNTGSSYNLRERLRFDKKALSEEAISKASGTNNTSFGSSDSSPKDSSDDYKPIALGSNHQAQVTEWDGVVSESNSKWLGTREWPLKKANKKFLIERDPIGRGRQDSCGCSESGSIDCVQFHIAEKRFKLKLELGTAFLRWKFDKMGEDVTLSWTADEEKKFQDIVTSNPPSLGKCFWDEIIESFPSRSRVDLVSYYYNVFLLRRRGHQNRVTPDDIDSDDESESGIATNGFGHEVHKSPGSILYSPKKPH